MKPPLIPPQATRTSYQVRYLIPGWSEWGYALETGDRTIAMVRADALEAKGYRVVVSRSESVIIRKTEPKGGK